MQHLGRKATFYIALLASEEVPASERPPKSVDASPTPTHWLEEKSGTEAAASL